MAKIHLLRNPRTAWEYDALWSFTLICWVFSHDMSIQYVFLYWRTLMEFWEQCKLKNHLSMKKSSLSRCLFPNWKCNRLQRFWSSTQQYPWHWRPIVLLWCSNESWTNVLWTPTIIWDVSANRYITNWYWISNVKKIMHSWKMPLHDMFKQ